MKEVAATTQASATMAAQVAEATQLVQEALDGAGRGRGRGRGRGVGKSRGRGRARGRRATPHAPAGRFREI
ncbi:hypothetical protein V2J09_016295 [Rumex salicifolius]